MKAWLLVCALAATALAAPAHRYKRTTKLDPKVAAQVQAAEQAWSAAEAEPDPAKQLDLWEQAAIAFGEVDGAPVDVKVKREAAYAAVLALKNALAVDPRVKATSPSRSINDAKPTQRPLPAREQKLVAAFDRYIKYADRADPELPGVQFLKAKMYWRFDELDIAIPIFRSIAERYPQHEVAEYSANLLLDSYNRLQQYDQLLAFADQLAKDATFLHGRDDLAHTVKLIQRQAQRKLACGLESKDYDQYFAAGKAYLDIYNANPESRDNDEVLYNAGVSFEEGRAMTGAIAAYKLLEKHYPNSKLTARATARLGKLYGDLALYDKAAEQLEQYAKKYAGEKDAYDAMSDAIYYRRALGDRAKVIENTKYLIKSYGAKKPREAAEAMWSLTSVYEPDPDPDPTIKHLREYLRTFGGKGGPDRVVMAHAKIGALLWKQSCPHASVDGLCVKANERAPRTCGTGSTRTLTATTRDAKKSELALAEFGVAMKEYDRRGRAFDDPAARFYFAQAKLAVADAELESYIAIAFPRGLSFDPADRTTTEASMKQFSEWLDQKQKAGGSATKKYEAVLSIKDAASSITAAARLGTVTQALANALVTGEIPRDMRTGPRAAEKLKAYCDAMIDVASPLEARAINAFAVCLAKSTELGWFGDSSAHCERQLLELKPEEFPRARELRIKPLLDAPVIVIEPPVR